MFSSRKKNLKHSPYNSVPVNRLASQSQASQQLQFVTKSQSPQQIQQSQPLYPWSAHTPPPGQWPSSYPRHFSVLSTNATAAGELYLFGGKTHDHIRNDLYMISTREFSTTLLQTSGDVPSPRFAHRAVFTSTTILIWGGKTDFSDQNPQNKSHNDSFYLFNLVSREWTRIVVHGPGPGGRYHHTMTLVGSKLFVFGGRTDKRRLNDIWALDLNSLKSNPFWESYDPAPGNKKPLPRAAHVSVSTGDHIIIFGGRGDPHDLNDTWSFDISTRKWTELQCTGSIPSPRTSHAAALVDDVMYVFGGYTHGDTYLGDLSAFNLSTQRWIAFQDIGPSPSGRFGHAMACDGTRVFVLGGKLSPGAQADEAKLIHVLDTKLLIYPKPESNAVKHSEKTTQLVRKVSAGLPTQGQPQQPTFYSPESDIHVEPGISPFQKATPGELDHPTSLQITWDRTPSLNDPPSVLPGTKNKPRRVPQEDDESSADHIAKLVAPDTPSEKEVVSLEHERIVDLDWQRSETLSAQTERDRHIAQLTDRLAQKTFLLEQAEANAAEAEKRAGLEIRELQAKLDESLLSCYEHLRALEQARNALQKAKSRAADTDERSQPACEHETELAELRAELEAVRLRLTDAEDGWAQSKAEADALRAQAAADLVNMDVDQVLRRLMERVRSVEAEMAALRGNEKGIEAMECRNEG